MVFDPNGLRNAGKSFMDSIIIELCFPRSPYPRHILYDILHEAVDESRKEAKRFSQPIWDAVGDLSVSICEIADKYANIMLQALLKLQDMLERPLKGPEGKAIEAEPRQMPEVYELWVDAQLLSQVALEDTTSFRSLLLPLSNLKKKDVLANIWKYINLVCLCHKTYKHQVDEGLTESSK